MLAGEEDKPHHVTTVYGSRVNRQWLGCVLSFTIVWALCWHVTSQISLMLHFTAGHMLSSTRLCRLWNTMAAPYGSFGLQKCGPSVTRDICHSSAKHKKHTQTTADVDKCWWSASVHSVCMKDSDSAAARSNNPAGNTHSELLDCCGGLNNVDYSKMDLTLMEELLKHINFHDSSFCIAVIAIIFNPLFWNVVARWEHRTRRLTRLFGSPYLGCYCLGFVIILLNVYRSHSMTVAMKAQAKWEVMDRTVVFYTGVALLVLGTLLVVSSFLALGYTGTFLGDYFGILMDEKVTGFPFNIIENPMYWGSTANYLGLALIGASPVGLFLTAIVAVAYKVAIRFEGPFTELIYQERSQRRKHE